MLTTSLIFDSPKIGKIVGHILKLFSSDTPQSMNVRNRHQQLTKAEFIIQMRMEIYVSEKWSWNCIVFWTSITLQDTAGWTIKLGVESTKTNAFCLHKTGLLFWNERIPKFLSLFPSVFWRLYSEEYRTRKAMSKDVSALSRNFENLYLPKDYKLKIT